jgi:amino acid transporter
MFFAFARDHGIPSFFGHVDKRFKSPIRAIWLAVLLAFLLALPSLKSAVAFSAATSIATIGLYTSYAIPIAIGMCFPAEFKKGPFNLGKASRPIALIAVLYVMFITIVFCLPTLNPVNSQTLNYSVVAVGIVLTYALTLWFVSARKWFTGPRRQIELEQMGIDITDPEQMAAADEKLKAKELAEKNV